MTSQTQCAASARLEGAKHAHTATCGTRPRLYCPQLSCPSRAGPEFRRAAAVDNDNRSHAGSLRDGVLTIHLEAHPASWYAEETDGPGLPVYAFAEEGHQPQIPGPLIRVPEGTEVRATVRNSIVGRSQPQTC